MHSVSVIVIVLSVATVSSSPFGMDIFNLGSLFGMPQQSPAMSSAMGSPCAPCSSLPARKKREASELEVISSDNIQCNSPELREMILKNLKSTLVESKEAIYAASRSEGQFAVACQPAHAKSAFAARSERFCADGSDQITCFVFEL